MTLNVTINCKVPQDGIPSDERLVHWAQASYRLSSSASVGVSVVDEEESKYLNAKYRQKNSPTNVLSFPLDMHSDADLVGENILGDIIICANVVAIQAVEQDKPLEAHWAHMVVHGMLHLQGFDHISEADAEKMEGYEVQILSALGYPSPY